MYLGKLNVSCYVKETDNLEKSLSSRNQSHFNNKRNIGPKTDNTKRNLLVSVLNSHNSSPPSHFASKWKMRLKKDTTEENLLVDVPKSHNPPLFCWLLKYKTQSVHN